MVVLMSVMKSAAGIFHVKIRMCFPFKGQF